MVLLSFHNTDREFVEECLTNTIGSSSDGGNNGAAVILPSFFYIHSKKLMTSYAGT